MSFLRGIGIQRYKLVYSVHVLDGGNNREKACYIIIFNKISKLKTQWSKLRPTCDKKKSFNTIVDSSKYNNFDQSDKQKDF